MRPCLALPPRASLAQRLICDSHVRLCSDDVEMAAPVEQEPVVEPAAAGAAAAAAAPTAASPDPPSVAAPVVPPPTPTPEPAALATVVEAPSVRTSLESVLNAVEGPEGASAPFQLPGQAETLERDAATIVGPSCVLALR